MFDYTSRYYTIETATLKLPDGRTVAYKRRRFLPQVKRCRCWPRSRSRRASGSTSSRTARSAIRSSTGVSATRTTLMRPTELTAEPGRAVRVPLPQA